MFVLCFLSLLANAQIKNFNGIWTGKIIRSDNKESINITLYIEDNNVYSVTKNESGERIKDFNKEVAWSKGFGEQLNYVWMNKGGVWTETQVYSLVW